MVKRSVDVFNFHQKESLKKLRDPVTFGTFCSKSPKKMAKNSNLNIVEQESMLFVWVSIVDCLLIML